MTVHPSVSRSPSDAPEAHLAGLTSSRFFAALRVVLFHRGWDLFARAPLWLELPRRAGYVAVSFFFVLSGFILTYKYCGAPTSRRAFWAARCSRIYPVYLLGNLLMVPFVLRYAPAGDRAISGLAHLFLVQAYFPQIFVSWNFPDWSIGVEALFYLLFPWLLVLLRRSWSNGRLLLAIALLWGIDLALPALYMLRAPDGIEIADAHASGFWLNLLRYAPPARLPELMLGACLGKIYLNDRARGLHRHGGRWSTVALAGLVGLLVCSYWLPFPMLHNGLLAPWFSMLILGVAHGGGPLGRILRWRPLILLGEASYGLYILQLPVALSLIFLDGGDVAALMVGMRAGLVPVYLGVLILVSLGSHRFIERPAQAALRRRLTRSPDAHARGGA